MPALYVDKVWGSETVLVNRTSPDYCMKVLVVNRGRHSSRHRHIVKHETFVVHKGELMVGSSRSLKDFKVHAPGSVITVLPGEWHWFGSQEGCEFWEISTYDDPIDSIRDPRLLSGEL